ncbi:ribosome assembly factor SBDS, partial [Candidatus Pacearchaeota archaeon CG_4_9_14_0_2_um_filter_30_8]
MTQTTARLRRNGMDFEVLVDLDDALKFRKGQTDYLTVDGDRVFSNIKRGDVAAKNDLEIAFKTTDPNEIGKIIVKSGEVLVDQDHRDEDRERKVKQVVDFLSKNAVDPQTGNPITPERIKSAIEQAHVAIKNVSIESQIKEIMDKLSVVIPIKIETKRIKITIPAIQTGKAYGLVTQYKEKENWL